MVYQVEHHPPHYYAPNTCYFVTASTVAWRPFLQSETNRDLLRDVLRDAVIRCNVTLFAWVILTNHYHLLLRTGESAHIGRLVKAIHGSSAVGLNRADGTPGRQVWYQYWDRTPRDEDEFWAYFNYIHINPIKHGCVRVAAAGLGVDGPSWMTAGQAPGVHECLSHYPYSSYQYYTRRYGEEFLTEIWLRYGFPRYVEWRME